MYHISDLKIFKSCPRLYYYKDKNPFYFKEFLRIDEPIIDLACKRLNIEYSYIGVKNDPVSRFFDNEDKFNIFKYARFEDNGLRVTVPLMIKGNNGYDIYFVYYKTHLKDLDITYYSLALDVLKNCNIKINNFYLIYVNPDYTFHKSLDITKAIIITNKINDDFLLNIINEKHVNYKKIIKDIESHNIDDYLPKKCNKCKENKICPNYFECFKEEKNLPDDSLMYLVSSQYKDKMANNGIIHLKDVDLSLIEGSRVQYAQIMASKNGGFFVDKLNLRNWMKKLSKFPITFIDFEWDRYLIPKYEGMKALDVMPFEYVLYTIDERGKMTNKSFVGTLDSRKDFIKSLLKNIPRSGPIVAYNAYNAEVVRLKELATRFPLYRRRINSLSKRFVDIAEPFTEGVIYDSRMHGNFSLKKLIEIISDKSYENFEISNGIEAIIKFREIDLNNTTNKDKIVDELKEYCGLDAYSLYLVYKYLKDKI